MRSQVLNKIEDIQMMGDRFHNQTIDLLFSGVNRRSKYAKKIMFRLDNVYLDSTQRWTPVTNTMARKLNGIMKSKTEKTFQKRLKKYVYWLTFNTHYGALFNKHQINEMLKEVKETK